MKNQIKKTVTTACLALMSVMALAQVRSNDNVPTPPTRLPGEMVPHPPKHLAGREPGATLKILSSLNGKIIAYQANDRYIYNSFTLQNGSKVTTVRFPEQMGKQLINAAGKGKSVTVQGFVDNVPDGVAVFHMVNLVVDGTQIAATAPAPPIVPINPKPETFTGKINDFKRDQGGAIRRLSLDNSLEVNLPPPAIEQLQALLKTGNKVKVLGFRDTPPSGAAVENDAPSIIHPETIELNGQTYLLR